MIKAYICINELLFNLFIYSLNKNSTMKRIFAYLNSKKLLLDNKSSNKNSG